MLRSRWIRLFLLSLLSALFLSSASVAFRPSNAEAWGAMRSGFNSGSLAANDDFYTGLVGIGFPINFFGNSYSNLYVNKGSAHETGKIVR